MLQRQDINLEVMAEWQGKFRAGMHASAPLPVSRPPQTEAMFWRSYALARTCLNREVLALVPRSARVLEIGVDKGVHLRCLASLGFMRTAGTHVRLSVVQQAREHAPTAACLQASALHLPFPDGAFDLVCTSGLMSFFNESRLEQLMAEAHRCTRRWLWGWGRIAEEHLPHGPHRSAHGPVDFVAAWRQAYPSLRLVSARRMATPEPGAGFQMFLMEKSPAREAESRGA